MRRTSARSSRPRRRAPPLDRRYLNIPAFLALVGEFLTLPIQYATSCNDGRPARVIKPRHAALRAAVRTTWIAYADAKGEDRGGRDLILEKQKSMEEFDRLAGLESKEMEEWLQEPGRWLSKKLAQLHSPPEFSPRGRLSRSPEKTSPPKALQQQAARQFPDSSSDDAPAPPIGARRERRNHIEG